ncbi:MAG: hypothetical protein ACNA8W_08205 [Bradymonadaceae bacterium]
MGEDNWRVQKAEELEVLLAQLLKDALSPDHPLAQWSAVIAFYCGLHYCSAVLSLGHGEGEFDAHTKRNNLLKRSYKELWKLYRPLFDLSFQVRYQQTPISKKNLRDMRPVLHELISKCRRRLNLPR